MQFISTYAEVKWWLNFCATLLLGITTLVVAIILGFRQIREQKKANEIALQSNQMKNPKELETFMANKLDEVNDFAEEEKAMNQVKSLDDIKSNIVQITQKIELKNRENQNKQENKKHILKIAKKR